MTVESVIKMAATLIGIEEPVTAYLEGQDAEGKKAVDALLGCLHLVEMELEIGRASCRERVSPRV